LQRQLNLGNAWTIDGCDLNEIAIRRNHGHNGKSLLYNIFDFSQDLQGKYDLVFLLDVIEHIPNPVAFLAAARFYMKPDGYMIVNVPALPTLYSKYDIIAGHVRRYTKASLIAEMSEAGLAIEMVAYWGLSLIPLVLLRKVALLFTRPEAVIKRGFVPPGILADKVLRVAMSAELAMADDVPYGASLLAIAGKGPP
jgi:Methyltransferase domain